MGYFCRPCRKDGHIICSVFRCCRLGSPHTEIRSLRRSVLRMTTEGEREGREQAAMQCQQCAFCCGGCPLVDVNWECKDLHCPLPWDSYTSLHRRLPSVPDFPIFLLPWQTTAHESILTVSPYLLCVPHKVSDHLNYPELCPLVGFFLATVFQVCS